MRYKLGKNALFSRMSEYGQNNEQQIKYLRHSLSVLMENNDFVKFDYIAKAYQIYYMLLNLVFELLRLKYYDYLIIVQSTKYEIIIEIRKT